MGTRDHSQLKCNGSTYYFTTTVVDWKPVFIKRSAISILLDSILFFQNERQVRTNGYCIMPNHLHWIFTLPENNDDIVAIIHTFKSYPATQVLKRLKEDFNFSQEPIDKIFVGNSKTRQEDTDLLLKTFSYPNHDKRSFHQFWQKDSDIKAIYTEDFLRRKLEYIHNNPIQPHWAIVEQSEDYPFSSCRYYHTGQDWNGINILSLL